MAPSALAKSKPVHYAGTTRDGDAISFTLAGAKLTQLKAYTPTLCGTSDPGGLPLSGSDPFDPPGAFPLARVTKRTAKRENAIWNTNLVTKNFVVSFRRGRHGVVTGKLHVDYSFLMIVYSYPISSRPWWWAAARSTWPARPRPWPGPSATSAGPGWRPRRFPRWTRRSGT